jgi:hypothetical protein
MFSYVAINVDMIFDTLTFELIVYVVSHLTFL